MNTCFSVIVFNRATICVSLSLDASHMLFNSDNKLTRSKACYYLQDAERMSLNDLAQIPGEENNKNPFLTQRESKCKERFRTTI